MPLIIELRNNINQATYLLTTINLITIWPVLYFPVSGYFWAKSN